MSRRKTTVYLDSDVATATKVLAAMQQRSESKVIEDALRGYLGTNDAETAGAELRALLDRVAQRSELDDEAAMALAVDEVHAVRAARHSSS